jgi:hypothetical protein
MASHSQVPVEEIWATWLGSALAGTAGMLVLMALLILVL